MSKIMHMDEEYGAYLIKNSKTLFDVSPKSDVTLNANEAYIINGELLVGFVRFTGITTSAGSWKTVATTTDNPPEPRELGGGLVQSSNGVFAGLWRIRANGDIQIYTPEAYSNKSFMMQLSHWLYGI